MTSVATVIHGDPLSGTGDVGVRGADGRRRRPAPSVELTGRGLRARDVALLSHGRHRLAVAPEVRALLASRRRVVEQALEGGVVAYGLNTHLGRRRNEVLPSAVLSDYQRYIVATHQAALGAVLPERAARAALVARIAGMARGGSGVSLPVFDRLVALLNHDVVPVLRAEGSVGAADITQLAELAAVVTGHGSAWHRGRVVAATTALGDVGLSPLELAPKDGLAVIGSNAVSLGRACLLVERLADVARVADLAAAVTLDALDGNLAPFHPAVASVRHSRGQVRVAALVRSIVATAGRAPSPPTNVQDAISLRTVPQVHGALWDQVEEVRRDIEVELRSATDNPLVTASAGAMVSNGNFSAVRLALAFEHLRLAMAQVGMVAERRMHKLLAARHEVQVADGSLQMVGSLPNLVVNAAAGLLARLRHAAQPVTLGGVSLNADVEDHASFLPQALDVAEEAVELLRRLAAIEVALAVDTIDVLDRRRLLGDGTGRICDLVRPLLPPAMTLPQAIDDIARALEGWKWR